MSSEVAESTSDMVPQSLRVRDDFLFLHELGEGSFSTVYLATERSTSRRFAVKVCCELHFQIATLLGLF